MVKILKNAQQRFYIEGMPNIEGNYKGKRVKNGIAGYHGPLQNMIGWILNLFQKTVAIKADNGTFYLNCESIVNILTRLKPEIYTNRQEIRKQTHDPEWVVRALNDLVQSKEVKVDLKKESNLSQASSSEVTQVEEELTPTPKTLSPQEQKALAVESAKEKFKAWWTGNNKLGQGDYGKKMEEMREALKNLDLPKKELTLVYYNFNWGFSFYYGKVDGALIPVPWGDGVLLKWQMNNRTEDYCWPIKDTEGNYFIPEKIVVEKRMGASGSQSTCQFLYDVSRGSIPTEHREMLEVLTPYADMIKSQDPDLYQEIQKRFPQKFP